MLLHKVDDGPGAATHNDEDAHLVHHHGLVGKPCLERCSTGMPRNNKVLRDVVLHGLLVLLFKQLLEMGQREMLKILHSQRHKNIRAKKPSAQFAVVKQDIIQVSEVC